MKDLSGKWVIGKELTRKEREILFILAASAGLTVYYSTRDHTTMEQFPFVCSGVQADISGIVNIPTNGSHKILSYDTVITILKEMVKEREVEI